jgi:hypothetical protein
VRTIDARGLRQLVGGDLELLADLRRTSPTSSGGSRAKRRISWCAWTLSLPCSKRDGRAEHRRRRPGSGRSSFCTRPIRTSVARGARHRLPDDISEIAAAWTRDHAPEFDLPYEDGHDHAIAHVLGALYRDRGDGALEADELSSDYDA